MASNLFFLSLTGSSFSQLTSDICCSLLRCRGRWKIRKVSLRLFSVGLNFRILVPDTCMSTSSWLAAGLSSWKDTDIMHRREDGTWFQQFVWISHKSLCLEGLTCSSRWARERNEERLTQGMGNEKRMGHTSYLRERKTSISAPKTFVWPFLSNAGIKKQVQLQSFQRHWLPSWKKEVGEIP